MTLLITKLEQAKSNSMAFLNSLLSNGQEEKSKALSMLKNAKYFFVCRYEEGWVFAPSRFVGFQNNTVMLHKKLVSEKRRNGLPTDAVLTKLSTEVELSSELYNILDAEYLKFCTLHGEDPSAKPTPRYYWIHTNDFEFENNALEGKLTIEDHATRIARTVIETVRNSGRVQKRKSKIKDTSLTEEEIKNYVVSLSKIQDNLCNLTGIVMSNNGDENFYPSLDRIDSNGDYDAKNLQLVCRFANKWKSDQENGEFLRLIKLIKNN